MSRTQFYTQYVCRKTVTVNLITYNIASIKGQSSPKAIMISKEYGFLLARVTTSSVKTQQQLIFWPTKQSNHVRVYCV